MSGLTSNRNFPFLKKTTTSWLKADENKSEENKSETIPIYKGWIKWANTVLTTITITM